MTYIEKLRNIGILAHVDAGKTTLTENFLFLSKEIKKMGNVDKGTCQTDFSAIEKERGISVISATTLFTWKDTSISLIDTPGHIDFSSEVERSLSIMDGVILVISAVEGIQSQTELILEATKTLNLPTIIFINKIDRIGSDVGLVIKKLSDEEGVTTFCPQTANNEENINAEVNSIWSKLSYASQSELIETIAETDDFLLDKYFQNSNLSFEELQTALVKAVRGRKLIPVFLGSSKSGEGISALLDAIVEYLPPPLGNINNNLSGRIFTIKHDKELGRIAGVRLFDGEINIRDEVMISNGKSGKVSRIRYYKGDKFIQKDNIRAGEIAYVGGLSTAQAGDYIGNYELEEGQFKFDSPLLMIKAEPINSTDQNALLNAFSILNSEDPQLEFQREEAEIRVKIRGAIQSEILQSTLKSRFNIDAILGKPDIIYRETISKSGFGFSEYTMPKPCWAIVKLLIEPAERGSGIEFISKVSVNDIKQRYQNEVENCVSNALNQGIKGWNVTDLKIILTEGEDHEIHSRPGDFIIATNMALMNGLNDAGTSLLEPIMKFKISSPEIHLGAIAGDLHKMRAEFETPTFENGKVSITGQIPLATSIDYTIKLSSLTSGKGIFSIRLNSYKQVADDLGKVKQYIGISPLDRSKYILKMRGAIR